MTSQALPETIYDEDSLDLILGDWEQQGNVFMFFVSVLRLIAFKGCLGCRVWDSLVLLRRHRLSCYRGHRVGVPCDLLANGSSRTLNPKPYSLSSNP